MQSGGRLEWTGTGGDQRALEGDELVSMNCWGFRPTVVSTLEHAMERFMASDRVVTDDEVLLPDVIGDLVRRDEQARFDVLAAAGRCVGMTHPDDLERLRPLVGPLVW